MSNEPRAVVRNVFQDGPYLQAAMFCESVLDEKDGVKTAVRIVDRINRAIAGPAAEVPDQMQAFPYKLVFLLKLKTGNSPGRHEVELRLVNPRGEEAGPPLSQAINFETGEERGVDVVMNLMLNIEHEGVYWLDVNVDGVRITRVPLRVIYVTQRHGAVESRGPVQ